MVVDNVHRVAVKQCDRLPRRVEGERPGAIRSGRPSRWTADRNARSMVIGVDRQRPMGADDTFQNGGAGENHVGRLVHRHVVARIDLSTSAQPKRRTRPHR